MYEMGRRQPPSICVGPTNAVHQATPIKSPGTNSPTPRELVSQFPAKPFGQNLLRSKAPATARERNVREPRRVRRSGPARKDCPLRDSADPPGWVEPGPEEMTGGGLMRFHSDCRAPKCLCYHRQDAWKRRRKNSASRHGSGRPEEPSTTVRSRPRKREAPDVAEQCRYLSARELLREQHALEPRTLQDE